MSMNPMKTQAFRVVLLSFFIFRIALFVPAISAEEPKQAERPGVEKLSDFMRVSKKEGRRQPQSFDTAIVKFVDRKGIEVDLIAAVHIGDRSYYEELNRIFKDYDALLYELVADKQAVSNPERLIERKEKSMLSGFQSGMGRALDLEFQLEHVDYTARNFVHADLSPDEFARRVADRGDLVQMLYRAVMHGAKKGKDGQDDEILMQGKLFGSLLASNPSLALKRFFAKEMIRQLDDSMWIIAGDGSAIITDRNEAALSVLRRQIKAGKKKLGIFYGGAHLPEFAKSLENEFKMSPVEVRWIIAWDLTSDQSARKE